MPSVAMFALSIGSPPASRVEISWNTETQVFDAVLVVNRLTVTPLDFSNVVRNFSVALKLLGNTGRPMVSTSSPLDLAELPEEPHAARIGPAAAASAAAFTPLPRKSRRLTTRGAVSLGCGTRRAPRLALA